MDSFEKVAKLSDRDVSSIAYEAVEFIGVDVCSILDASTRIGNQSAICDDSVVPTGQEVLDMINFDTQSLLDIHADTISTPVVSVLAESEVHAFTEFDQTIRTVQGQDVTPQVLPADPNEEATAPVIDRGERHSKHEKDTGRPKFCYGGLLTHLSSKVTHVYILNEF